MDHSATSKRSKFRSFFSFKPSKGTETLREPIKPLNIDAANSVSVMLATAQRIDLDANIRASISVGQKKYWRSLASGANFMGKDLRRCLEVIHDDIVVIWNFPQLSMLRRNSFRGKVSKLVDDLADQGPSPNDSIMQNTANIAGAAGAITAIAAGTANPVGFIVGPIIAGAVFAKWAYDVYRATPGVLRCFMAYIIDLIIIMQMIFVISEARQDGVVTAEEVEDVLRRFEANQCNEVHEDIRKFVRETGIFKAVMGKDVVFDKMVELIDNNRADQRSPREGRR
jgi:ABC-type multidrug transport system fused ATPase/permease subunit